MNILVFVYVCVCVCERESVCVYVREYERVRAKQIRENEGCYYNLDLYVERFLAVCIVNQKAKKNMTMLLHYKLFKYSAYTIITAAMSARLLKQNLTKKIYYRIKLHSQALVLCRRHLRSITAPNSTIGQTPSHGSNL